MQRADMLKLTIWAVERQGFYSSLMKVVQSERIEAE
jgi:hypothetical protein